MIQNAHTIVSLGRKTNCFVSVDMAVSQSLPSFTVGSRYSVTVNKKLVLLGL